MFAVWAVGAGAVRRNERGPSGPFSLRGDSCGGNNEAGKPVV